MICHYFPFLNDEIWLDWQGSISLGIILFSVLAKYNLICRIWTFQFIQDHPLDLAGRAFALGWYRGAWVLHWAHHSFGLGEWDSEPISLTPSRDIEDIADSHCTKVSFIQLVVIIQIVFIASLNVMLVEIIFLDIFLGTQFQIQMSLKSMCLKRSLINTGKTQHNFLKYAK